MLLGSISSSVLHLSVSTLKRTEGNGTVKKGNQAFLWTDAWSDLPIPAGLDSDLLFIA